MKEWLHRLHAQREEEISASLATPVRRASNQSLDNMSPLLAVAGLSPSPAAHRLRKPQKGTDVDEYLICAERSMDGIVYHIIPSPVTRGKCMDSPVNTRGQHSASPLVGSPVSCQCSSPLHQQVRSVRFQCSPVSRHSQTQSPVSSAHSPAFTSPTHGGMSARSATDAFKNVAAAVSAAFLCQSKFQLAGAFRGIPYIEAHKGVLSRRRMPRVSSTL